MDQIKKLSDTEIEEIIRKMDRMFSEEGYEKTYEWALRLIKEYPNCNMLIWQTAAKSSTSIASALTSARTAHGTPSMSAVHLQGRQESAYQPRGMDRLSQHP